jgi:hypothetical protein
MGLERGPLSLESKIEELLERKRKKKKSEITAVGLRGADHATPFYPLKLALASPTIGGRSVGIARSQTQAAEFLIWRN